MVVTEFYKSKLTKEQVKLYEKLYSDIKNGQFDIVLNNCTCETAQVIFEAVFLDHVELYYVSCDAIIDEIEESSNGRVEICSEIHLTDIYPGKIKEEIIKRFDLAVKRIKSILPNDPTDLDKEIAIIKYIHRICYSDLDNEFNQNAASVLAFGKAQCSGYAKAIALLLNKFRVECFVATGEVLTQDFKYCPHAWNIVKINNKYYHLDAIYGHENRLLKYKMDLEFFNICDAKIKRTHKWSTQYPECFDNSFDFFKEKILLNNKPLKNIILPTKE